jgi:hypothetical protein
LRGSRARHGSAEAARLIRRRRPSQLQSVATGVAFLACVLPAGFSHAGARDAASAAPDRQVWICRYIATTPDGPLQIATRFRIVGDELAEFDTIPRGLGFSEKYKILENNDSDIVAAISIAKIGDTPPPGVGAVVVIIAKRNGLFQQSGAILGLRTGAPTLGHCESE